MSEIVKSEYNALDEQGNYKTHYFKTSADQVVGLANVATSGNYDDLSNKPIIPVKSVNGKTGDVVVGEVTNLSISGKTITVTFADDSTKTLTTQDTAPYSGSATSIGGASATKPAVVVTSYKNGATWYRKYSDGWVEQGGLIAANASVTVTLPVAMADSNYYVGVTLFYTGNAYGYDQCAKNGRTTTKFTVYLAATEPRCWYVCGEGA